MCSYICVKNTTWIWNVGFGIFRMKQHSQVWPCADKHLWKLLETTWEVLWKQSDVQQQSVLAVTSLWKRKKVLVMFVFVKYLWIFLSTLLQWKMIKDSIMLHKLISVAEEENQKLQNICSATDKKRRMNLFVLREICAHIIKFIHQMRCATDLI